MTTCHFLPYIEQQGIIALLGYLQLGLEEVTLTYLLLATLSRGDIDLFTHTLAITFLHRHALTAGVIFRHTVVIPQHTITLA